MAAKYQPTEMRPIWYRRRLWSPRTTIVFTIINAIVAGFFLGVTLLRYLRGRSALSWLTPLAITFSSGVTTLRGTFEALRDCPRPTKTAREEAPLAGPQTLAL
jgi:hypothetical protein